METLAPTLSLTPSSEDDSGVSSWPFSTAVRARFGFVAIWNDVGMKDRELTNENSLVLKLFLRLEGALDVFCTWTLVFTPVRQSHHANLYF